MKNCLRIFFALAILVLLDFAEAKSVEASSTESILKKIIAAAETGDSKSFDLLLKNGKVNLNSQDAAGMTPLMGAALGGNEGIIKKLLKQNVDLEIKNSVGETALAVAVTNDQFEVADLLIKNGANVDLTVAGEDGDTLFIKAALGSKSTASLILSKKNILLNLPNKKGDTALIKCALYGNNEMLRYLITKGADPSIKNNAGLTAADIAKKNHNNQGYLILKKNKAHQ